MSIEDQHDALFKALGHRARRQILDLLKDGAQTTGALCDALPEIDRCTVMQHLKVLEKAGLVVVERRGRERWNHLDALPIHNIQQRWIGPYAAHAVNMMAQISNAVDATTGSATVASAKDEPAKP
ncbi:ArsR/SmtB family transcription factor [Roseinatronobacter sp.]